MFFLTVCSVYGDSFREFRDTSMIGLNDVIIEGMSLNQCMDACLQETNFVCRTVDYSHGMMRCQLSVATAYTHPSAAVEGADTAPNWTIAHRNCA